MMKAIFMDVDGTLLSHKSRKVPDSTVRSLKKLQQQGILVFVCTGRHLPQLHKLPLDGVAFDGFVTLNGQLVLDQAEKMLYGNPLPETVRREIAVMFTGHELPILLMEEQRNYINHIDDLVEYVQEKIASPLPQVQCYEGAPIYQASIYLKNDEEELLRDRLPADAKMVRWMSGGVDVIPTSGGKAEGMKHLLHHFGLSREEVMAFGDGDNDTDMLSFAGIGVAMGNGTDCAKAAAEFVTADIDDDGVEKALRYYGFL